MRVVILVQHFPPKTTGGVETATLNIAQKLFQRGVEVILVTESDKGHDYIDYSYGFCIHRVSKDPLHLWKFIKTMRITKSERPDVVHIQTFYWNGLVFLINKILSTPVIIYGRMYYIYNLKPIIKPWIRLGIRTADEVIALTDDMKKEILNLYDREVRVIPNGVSDNFFQTSRKPAKNDSDVTTILFVGRLVNMKGVKDLIEAISVLRERSIRTHVKIVGDGPEMGALKKTAQVKGLSQNITFFGEMHNRDVPVVMSESEIFVLPSKNEGFSNTILEAMASGLPIIASRVGGNPSIIIDKESGLLVEPNNPTDIADKIEILINDEALKNKIIESNRSKILKYRWENVAEQLETIYLSRSRKRHQKKKRNRPLG